MTRVVALLVLLAACGGNPLPEWKTDPQPGPNSKRVDHLIQVVADRGHQAHSGDRYPTRSHALATSANRS